MAIVGALLLVGFARASAAFDNADLVQSRLFVSNASSEEPVVAFMPEYRLTISDTWGDDHVCMTEIEFLDSKGVKIPATYKSASSCWGCAVSCANCTVDYGNPNVLFDGDAETDTPQAYFCTDFGSFDQDGNNGAENITFSLNARPHSFSVRRADVGGSAIAKAFALFASGPDGSWDTIAVGADLDKELSQTAQVEATAGEVGRWWEFQTAACTEEGPAAAKDNEARLETDYIVAHEGGWQNNGHGIYFDGPMGTLKFGDVDYFAKQMHFQFPTYRMKGSENNGLGGELHITHQSRDGKGTSHTHQEGLLVLVIPLRLPVESGAPTKTESWFEHMGLSDLPTEGATKALNSNFSLGSVFDEQLGGSYSKLTCEADADGKVGADKPTWILLDEPATITGKVVMAFKAAFPFSMTYQRDGLAPPVAVDPTTLTSSETVSDDSAAPSWVYTPPAFEAPPSVPPIPGMKWVRNEKFAEGCGEFQSLGEWYIPPAAAAPAALSKKAL